MAEGLKERLRALARELGFSEARACRADGVAPGLEALDEMVAEGRHADMEWLAAGRAPRARPELLLPGLRSALVVALDYGGPRPPPPAGVPAGRVSRYAWGRDYHGLATKRLRRLARRLRAEGVACTFSVDRGPVLERAWAKRAGLGYLGRNACAIRPARGSWFFIGVLFLDAELEPDDPVAGGAERHCGSCRRCVDACPTGAIVGPGRIDARRCLAWATVEHRGEIPPDLAERIGDRVFGCDDCQEVCPHNAAPPPPHPDLAPRRPWLDLRRLLATPDEVLDAELRGTALRRAGAAGLKRNALAVLAALGLRPPEARAALDHPDPAVRAQARRLLDG